MTPRRESNSKGELEVPAANDEFPVLQLSTLAGLRPDDRWLIPRSVTNAAAAGPRRIGGDPLAASAIPAAPSAGLALDFEPSELDDPALDWRRHPFLGSGPCRRIAQSPISRNGGRQLDA